MALQAEAKRIAAEFEFTDEEVNKNVAEFINQMSKDTRILIAHHI